jgi:peptidoglycan/LPS O-acetylase OafA/YrhL
LIGLHWDTPSLDPSDEETSSMQVQESSRTLVTNRTTIPTLIPAIDGLRGLAIIGVLLFHLGIPKCSLGWTGVELFFVISGFLITRILLNTCEDRDYFKRFYVRRALRIFPIYYLVVITYTAAAVFSTSVEALRMLPMYYVYLQTIPQLRSQFTVVAMLGHTWTLAIEEQFYFIWPLVIFLVKGRKLLVVITVMIFAAMGLRLLSLRFANPFLVDGWIGVQIDTLAAGAMVAYTSRIYDRQTMQRYLTVAFLGGVASLLLLVSIVGTSVFWTPKIWGRSWYGPLLISVLACTFAGIVGLAAIGHRWTRWLEFRSLMRWGKISYGIYLFHPFVFLFVDIVVRHTVHAQSHLASRSIMLVKLSLTYLVGSVSWKLIESPILQLKGRFAR